MSPRRKIGSAIDLLSALAAECMAHVELIFMPRLESVKYIYEGVKRG